MKEEIFLRRISAQGKLKIAEPSDEICDSYLRKSENNLISAKILFSNNQLEDTISLSYYSMYNKLVGLFFKVGIKSENHSASIILMKKIFELDNLVIMSAKKERVDKQYYIDFEITKQEVGETIVIAEDFNKDLDDFISKLTNDKIEAYRKKFKEVVR